MSAKPVDWPALLPRLIGEGTHTTIGSGLEDEVLASLNATEMARRRFREIARIAGLIFQSHPGKQAQPLSIHALERPTPFALPLMVERFRERLSTETLADRLARMVQALEQAADATTGTHLAQHPVQSTDMAWDLPDSSGARTQRARLAAGGDTPRRTRRRHGF